MIPKLHWDYSHVAALLTAVISLCEALVLAAAAAPRASGWALEAITSAAFDQPDMFFEVEAVAARAVT